MVQLASYLDFLAELVEAMEAKMVTTNEKATNTERELCEAKARASKAEQELRKQKKSPDNLLSNAIRSAIRLGKASKWVASRHRWMTNTHRGEEAMVLAKAEVAYLKKSFQAKIKDLKEDANNQVQWL